MLGTLLDFNNLLCENDWWIGGSVPLGTDIRQGRGYPFGKFDVRGGEVREERKGEGEEKGGGL